MSDVTPSIVDASELSDQQPMLEVSSQIEETGACERRVTLTISESEVARYFTREFNTLADGAHVPGFRPGKAPRDLLERRFRKEVADRVKSALVVDALDTFSKEGSVTPIGEPQFSFDLITLPESGPFVFTFDLEVRPVFDLPEWKGMELVKPSRQFDDADIDKAVREVMRNNDIVRVKSGGAATGDFLEVRFQFSDESGTVFHTSEIERVCVREKLTFHDGVIEKFDELMKGVCRGEKRTTTVTLSSDTIDESMAGKTVTVVISVLEVFEPEEIRIEEGGDEQKEILERLGVSTVEELRQGLLGVLQQQLQYEQNRRLRKQVIGKLTVAATWEIPPRLLRRQTDREIRRVVLELQRSGYPDDFIQSQINHVRQNARTTVTQALKEHFVLEKIGEAELIDATEADYDLEMRMIARQQGVSLRRMQKHIEQSGETDILRNQIVERKVIARIVSEAKVTEVPFELPISTQQEESLDLAIFTQSNDADMATATEDDLRAVGREMAETRRIDPSAKIS
ncbi:MAG: trigger factor [Thermoguttaceae bacterium]